MVKQKKFRLRVSLGNKAWGFIQKVYISKVLVEFFMEKVMTISIPIPLHIKLDG